MLSSAPNEQIRRHYAPADLGARILSALREAGKDLHDLTLGDLAPVDELHVRGREATLELACVVGLRSNMHVLDVGCGIGGPARRMAREFGCQVTGIDMRDEYCRVAEMLSERVGLSHLVRYQQGDARDLPFPKGTFDVVWAQHTAMNVPDKASLYHEMTRVLKRGGALAIHDILAGPVSPVHFPASWAHVPEAGFLISGGELRRLLQASGLTIASWKDTTEAVGAWLTKLAREIGAAGPPPLGLHIVLGPDFQVMAQNLRRNIEEGRTVVAQVVARKPEACRPRVAAAAGKRVRHTLARGRVPALALQGVGACAGVW